MPFSIRDLYTPGAQNQFAQQDAARQPYLQKYGNNANATFAQNFDNAFGPGWDDGSMLANQQAGMQPGAIQQRYGVINQQHQLNGNGGSFGGIQSIPNAMSNSGLTQNSAGIDSIYNRGNTTPLQSKSTPSQIPAWNTTDRQSVISNFYNQNKNDPRAISDAMRQYGVSNQDFMSATGMNQEAFDKYFNPLFGNTQTSAPVSWMDELKKDGVLEYKDPKTGLTYMRTDNSGYNPYADIDGQYSVGNYTPGGEYSVYNSKGEDTGRKGKYGTKKTFADYLPYIALVAGAGLAGTLTAGATAGAAGATGAAEAGAATAGATGAGAVAPAAATAGTGLTMANAANVARTIAAVAGLTGLGNSGGSNGSSGSPGGGGGNVDVGSLIDIVGGGLDASRQGQAADRMLSWMNTRQGMVDNLYSPGSPEYNQLWQEMSRKDAAAGRNSQYGPRSVDLAARIAQIKADQNVRMTGALAQPYANALNQNASKYAGLQAALQKAIQEGSIRSMADIAKWLEQNYNIGVNAGGSAPGTNPGGYTGPDGQHYNNPSAYDTGGGGNDSVPWPEPDDYGEYF